MNFFEFEKQAGQKLDSYPSSIDAEALWKDIEPQLKKKKDHRVLWMFLLGLGGVMLIGFISYSTIPRVVKTTGTDGSPMASEKWTEKGFPLAKREIYTPHFQQIEQRKQFPGTTISETTSNAAFKSRQFPVDTDFPKTTKSFDEEEQLTQRLPDAMPFAPLAKKEEQSVYCLRCDTLPAWASQNQRLVRPVSNPIFKKDIGLQLGWGSFIQHFEGNDKEYLSLRRSTEEALELLQVQIGFRLVHRSGISLQTGLQGTRLVTRFNFDRAEFQEYNYPNGIQTIFISEQNRDTSYLLGNVSESETTIYAKTTYNNTYLLDIPVLLGYSWTTRRWALGVEAGALVNLRLQSHGEMLNQQAEVYHLQTDSRNWFKNNLSLRTYAGLRVDYFLNPNWYLSVTPAYLGALQISTDQNPIRQKLRTFQMGVGVNYRLGIR